MSATTSETYTQRFSGISRLYGNAALTALSKAHIAVVGLGGVGTWAAEALARSGIGEITCIELDDICITNTNRQSHALQSNIGKQKNQVISDRLTDINPECIVHTVYDFLTKDNIPKYIGDQHHVIIDAMDATHIKTALVAYTSAKKIRLVTVGSSGGKINPQKVTVSDLYRTHTDPMLSKLRSLLYKKYNFSRERKKFKVDAVYSTEQMIYPKPDGTVCMDKKVLQEGVKLDCAGGFGSSVMVTGTFGFIAAHKAIERYLEKNL